MYTKRLPSLYNVNQITNLRNNAKLENDNILNQYCHQALIQLLVIGIGQYKSIHTQKKRCQKKNKDPFLKINISYNPKSLFILFLSQMNQYYNIVSLFSCVELKSI